jgi:hypothetical protein
VRGELSNAFVRILLLLLVSAVTAFCGSVTLELSGGSIIRGELISWDGQQAFVKAEFGLVQFKRDQLSPATIDRLEFLSKDRQHLLTRISDLESTVESLKKENASLRQQLEATAAGASPNPALGKETPTH